MSAATLDDALDQATTDRAYLITMDCRIDPQWDDARIIEQLLDTALAAAVIVRRELGRPA